METVHLVIEGKVQGVFYRANARDKALELGVTGWVKNMQDGNVEISATGDKESLGKFIEWCRKGPPRAQVTDVVISKIDETPQRGFSIIK